MRRRDLIAASVALPSIAAAATAHASDTPAAPASLNIAALGLPIIANGRIRNYVFVSLRLHLGSSATVETVRAKEAYIRDALVRTGHRTPFVVPNDWNRINAATLSASAMQAAARIAGRGAVTRVEVVSQSPRRRMGAPAR